MVGGLSRRLLFVAIVAFAGGVASVHPEVIENFCENIFPSDAAKRQALDLCFLQDHKFNRLDADEREACYHRNLTATARETTLAVASPAPIEPNAVDMRRAAGEGHMPRNDVRRREQLENALHLPH
jgi:hypothetical protein